MGRLPRPSHCPDGSLTFRALNRGNNRHDVFHADGDRLAYLESLARTRARYPFDLYAYCPMTNHVHLVLRPGPGQSIGRIMQSLTVAHTWRHHQRNASSGHVWQGRFKSPAVQDGGYLLAVPAYVEADPARAGMVDHPTDHRRSSHRGRLGMATDPLPDPSPEWAQLAHDEPSRRAAWRARVAAGPEPAMLDAIRAAGRGGLPIGDPAWCVGVAARLGLPAWPPRPRGRPRLPKA